MYRHSLRNYARGQRKIVQLLSERRWISTSCSMKNLSVTPQCCLYDEEAIIRCKDLKPNEDVTLLTTVKDHRGQSFVSNVKYRADDKGCIDLRSSPALDGPFKGVFPMGPICSVHSTEAGKEQLGFLKKEDSTDTYELQLLSGHFSDEAAASELPTDKVIATTTHKRFSRSSDVEKIIVKTGNIRGILFLPPGEGPFPAVIDMYGSTGGLNTSRAGLLASRGIAAFSLAYFRYDDLPRVPIEMNIAYFEEAVKYLLDNKKVLKPSIGVIGLSMGSSLASAMGTFIPEVKAVVAMNGFPAICFYPLRVKDRIFEHVHMDMAHTKFDEEGILIGRDCFQSIAEKPDVLFPLEAATEGTEFLFITVGDDLNWNCQEAVATGIERMRKYAKTNYKHIHYEGAGHQLNPPYFPLCRTVFHPIYEIIIGTGGEVVAHSRAQVEAWQIILKFFTTNLVP